MPSVLVVEDDELIRATLLDLFNFEGYTVISAADGQAALATLAEEHADLIVLDLMMPNMDGREFLARRQSLPAVRAVPTIVLSAAREAADIQPEQWGVSAVILKPFELDDLLRIITETLRASG